MCTTKVSPTWATMSPLASISMPELSMATCPRGSLSTAKISPADAATARCTSSRSAMYLLWRGRPGITAQDRQAVLDAGDLDIVAPQRLPAVPGQLPACYQCWLAAAGGPGGAV